MKKHFIISFILFACLSCRKVYDAPIPSTTWDMYESPSSVPLKSSVRPGLEGVYTLQEANDFFGPLAAAKWSYTANGTDTVFHFSLFCENQVGYLICEGKRRDSSILLNGYWRKMQSTATGKVRLTISETNGGKKILSGNYVPGQDPLIITGVYGNGEEEPTLGIRMQYQRPCIMQNRSRSWFTAVEDKPPTCCRHQKTQRRSSVLLRGTAPLGSRSTCA
jgi:hypothetical protein